MSKFQVIVSDPPWALQDSLTMSNTPRGAAANYPLLDTDELCKLKVQDIADPSGCILVLWVLGSMLEDGMRVMKSWGFTQKQTFVWVKTKKQPLESLKKNLRKKRKMSGAELISNVEKDVDALDLNETLAFGMGRLFRQTHEICLVGINSTKIYKKLKDKSQRSVSFHQSTKHSTKPDDLQNRLDKMFPGTAKLEMFARRHRPGWTVVGNEVCNGEDIRDSVERLISSHVQSTIIKQ